MKMKLAAIVMFLGVVIVLLVFYSAYSDSNIDSSQCPNFLAGEIKISETVLNVGLADTDRKRSQGLSGCPQVPDQHGLLFSFNPARPAVFWMKDMLIPIDIIWINQEQVVGIEHNVSPPSHTTKPEDLEQYHSPGTIDHVLEIAGGQAKKHNISIGDAASSITNGD